MGLTLTEAHICLPPTTLHEPAENNRLMRDYNSGRVSRDHAVYTWWGSQNIDGRPDYRAFKITKRYRSAYILANVCHIRAKPLFWHYSTGMEGLCSPENRNVAEIK